MLYQPLAIQTRYIVGFGFFIAFVDNKKNMEDRQPYPLRSESVRCVFHITETNQVCIF